MSLIRQRWPLAVLIVVSIVLVYLAFVVAGAEPMKAMLDIFKSSLGNAKSITQTLKEFTPLLISGLAVFLALRAGLFNIGVEGQFTIGALTSAVVALRIPGIAGIFVGIVAGMAAGALWALPAAWIKAYRGGHEVITTIMLNNIAGLMATALAAGVFKDPKEESPTTATLPAGQILPNALTIGDLSINSGVLLGIIATGIFWYWLRKTVSGYELQAVGANPTAAQFAGVDHRKVLLRALLSSGAIGGLAGAVQVFSFEHRFYPSISSGYGFDALGVAMLSGSNPIGLLPSAALFGILNKSGPYIQVIDGVPKGLTLVVLALLIVIAAAVRYRKAGESVA